MSLMSEINKIYKKIYLAALLSGLLLIFFLIGHPNDLKGVLAFTALIAIGSYMSIQAFKAIYLLPGKIPYKILIAGLFLIIGGAIFDITNTIIQSPELDREANPIARLFLSLSYSTNQIYLIGLIAQLLLVSVISALWVAFLKGYPTMLKNISPKSWLDTIFLIHGGPNSKKFDVILGRNIDYFYYVSSVMPIMVGLSLYRWYLGLEWLNLVPISRIFVPSLIFIVSFLLYTYLSFRWATKEISKV